MATIDELRAEIAASRTVQQSAIMLIEGMAARIDELIAGGNTSPDLAALRDELRADREALAAAVVRGTDAEGEDTTDGGQDTDMGGEDTGAGGEDTIAG